jgi:outer membrane protein
MQDFRLANENRIFICNAEMTLITPATGLHFPWRQLFFCAVCLVLWASPFAAHAQSSAQNGTLDLTLEQFLQLVLERNESIQARMLELEVNRRKARAEYGVFEPELFGSVSREVNKRENTVEQQQSQIGQSFFAERNDIYQGGIETLVPSGARLRLGYTLRDIENTLQQGGFFTAPRTNGEFQAFFGLSMVQPLLKNAWYGGTLAGVRIAALSSDIAFQDYRRQLMLIVSTAEASYWNLYMAQEQVRFFRESVATAEKIFNDNRARLEAGKGSELEVLEAEAGLALRRSRLSDAEQKRYEAANRVISLYSETVIASRQMIRAVDQPHVIDPQLSYYDIWRTAFELNPDYLIQRLRLMQESVRVGYARNQRLPELNFRGSYGVNGLGETPGQAWEDITAQDFPSWSLGIELRVPLAGGIKAGNELAAARLREKQAAVLLREVETQIANAIDTTIHKVRSTRDSVQSYQTVVRFTENLLESALARLDVGRIESRKVLEVETDAFEARNAVVDAMVQFQRARLELELMQGAVLKARSLELTQAELQARTAQLARRARISDAQYERFIRDVQDEYRRKSPAMQPVDTPDQAHARAVLYQQMNVWDVTNTPPARVETPLDNQLRESLRGRLDELKP